MGMPIEIYLILGVLLVAIFYAMRHVSINHDLPYESQKYLLTPAEKLFFASLIPAVDGHYIIFSKVRMGDVLKVVSGLDAKRGLVARGKIQQKHFDFVLCNKSMEIICCIELNDKSHAKRDRVRRDQFVRAACKHAGVPLVEFKCQSSYEPGAIKERIFEAVNSKSKADANTL